MAASLWSAPGLVPKSPSERPSERLTHVYSGAEDHASIERLEPHLPPEAPLFEA